MSGLTRRMKATGPKPRGKRFKKPTPREVAAQERFERASIRLQITAAGVVKHLEHSAYLAECEVAVEMLDAAITNYKNHIPKSHGRGKA